MRARTTGEVDPLRIDLFRGISGVLFGLLGACGSNAADIESERLRVASEQATSVEFNHLRAEEISAQRAVIRFETSVETSCVAQYGFSEDQLDERATDPDMDPSDPFSITHQVPLEDLPANTEIFVRAEATTRGDRTFYSDSFSFETLPSGGSGDDSLSNVALLSEGTTVADVSSNWGDAANDENFGANLAIDGQMATEWSSNGDGDNAFLSLDLGQSRALVKFGFRSRKMTDGSAIIERVQLVIDDAVLGPFDTPNPDERYEFELNSPIITNRVRVEAVQTTGGNTGAKEIELFVEP